MGYRKWLNKRKKKGRLERNGSLLLQKLIADCNGITNPIRTFSEDEIYTATDLCILSVQEFFKWVTGVIGGRPYTIKDPISFILNSGEDFMVDSNSSLYEDHQGRALSDFLKYKADCLTEGELYAREKLSESWSNKDYFTSAGFTGERAFYKDIVLSARVSNHSGFLKLIGCCLESVLPVMVFENTEYGSLNRQGSVGSMDGPLLPWNFRLKIAKQVAIAVTYLHTAFPRIILHRNINPSNVFLDKNRNAKLTDFSLSVNLAEGKSSIKDEPVGTVGYIDPLCYTTGLVTEYSDVFSFGIFMLVLLMGRPATDTTGSSGDPFNILDYVKDLRGRGEPVEFGGDSNDMRPDQMKMFLELALRCCEEKNEDRPKMILVAKELKLIERSLDS